jgi:hypothetical protein
VHLSICLEFISNTSLTDLYKRKQIARKKTSGLVSSGPGSTLPGQPISGTTALTGGRSGTLPSIEGSRDCRRPRRRRTSTTKTDGEVRSSAMQEMAGSPATAIGHAWTLRKVQENQEEVLDHLRSLEHAGGGWSTLVDGGSRWRMETSMT